jgi:hypothetical protein
MDRACYYTSLGRQRPINLLPNRSYKLQLEGGEGDLEWRLGEYSPSQTLRLKRGDKVPAGIKCGEALLNNEQAATLRLHLKAIGPNIFATLHIVDLGEINPTKES